MNAMSNQKNNQQSNDVDNKGDGGVGEVDQELLPPGSAEKPPERDALGRWLPGNALRFEVGHAPIAVGGGRQSAAKMLAAAMVGSLERKKQRVGEVLDLCIESSDPYKWGLYLKYAAEFLKGQPGHDAPSSFEFAKSLMNSIEQLKAENMELRRQLDLCAGQTVDANEHYHK